MTERNRTQPTESKLCNFPSDWLLRFHISKQEFSVCEDWHTFDTFLCFNIIPANSTDYSEASSRRRTRISSPGLIIIKGHSTKVNMLLHFRKKVMRLWRKQNSNTAFKTVLQKVSCVTLDQIDFNLECPIFKQEFYSDFKLGILLTLSRYLNRIKPSFPIILKQA